MSCHWLEHYFCFRRNTVKNSGRFNKSEAFYRLLQRDQYVLIGIEVTEWLNGSYWVKMQSSFDVAVGRVNPTPPVPLRTNNSVIEFEGWAEFEQEAHNCPRFVESAISRTQRSRYSWQ